MEIRFRINGEAFPQPRQRHRIVKTKAGKTFVQNYVPRDCPAAAFKEIATQTARSAYAGELLTGPLRLELEIVLPRPKHLIWKRKPMPRTWATNQGDIDNYTKLLADSFTDAENIWGNDHLVADLAARKHYAAGNEEPHVAVTISQLS